MELQQTNLWSDPQVSWLLAFLGALAIIVMVFVVNRPVGQWLQRIGTRMTHSRTVGYVFNMVARVIIIAAGFAVAFKMLHIDGAVNGILASAGIIGIALGFAMQEIIANFIAGIIIAIQRPIHVRRLIKVGDCYGIVEHIHLRTTTVRTLQGQVLHIPNKTILLSTVQDFNDQPTRRVEFEFGVGYQDDFAKAKQLAIDAVTGLELTVKDMPIEFYYEEVTESSVKFIVRFWTAFHTEPDYMEARSQAVVAVFEAFRRSGITVPYAMRTVELPEQYRRHVAK
jgi:small conductance mechanosensitive channel